MSGLFSGEPGNSGRRRRSSSRRLHCTITVQSISSKGLLHPCAVGVKRLWTGCFPFDEKRSIEPLCDLMRRFYMPKRATGRLLLSGLAPSAKDAGSRTRIPQQAARARSVCMLAGEALRCGGALEQG